MTARITFATAARVLLQLRRDRRTLVLVFVVPPMLLALFRYVFHNQGDVFDRIGGPLVGLFPFISMFLVTSIAMLRERTTGTLERQADQVVHTLSGGERSRVSLATALLGEPDLLVLDEPTVGLDPVLRRDLWATFHLLADDGATLLVSSHVMDEAERCDELLLMRGGDLLATESPDGLRRRTGQQDLDEAFLALIEERGPA